MTDGIPVMIHLPVEVLRKLERIAQRKQTTVRALIVDHLTVSLERAASMPPLRNRSARRPDALALAARILELHHQGLRPKQIALELQVSQSLVSQRLRAAGIRHRAVRTPKGDR